MDPGPQILMPAGAALFLCSQGFGPATIPLGAEQTASAKIVRLPRGGIRECLSAPGLRAMNAMIGDGLRLSRGLYGAAMFCFERELLYLSW